MTDPIEEKDKPETEPEKVETPEPEPKGKAEKTLTQSEVNKLMADERRKHKAEIDKIAGEYADYRKTIEDREAAANEAAAKKVEVLRKNLPEPMAKLLDKLTPIEQLEFLSDPANVITKSTIPELPEPGPDHRRQPETKVII